VVVCLFVCQQLCAKTSKRICMKFPVKVGNGPVNKRLNFGGDPDHRIRIATLVRRALAEVCMSQCQSINQSINICLLRQTTQANNVKQEKCEKYTNNIKEAAVSNKRGKCLICLLV